MPPEGQGQKRTRTRLILNPKVKTMKTIVPFFAAFFISLAVFCQSGPELVFTNPVLVSGTALKQGAVYRFSNVTTGVDATVKLKKFSRNDIVMPTVDNSVLGWNKALQPEFGLPGVVAPFQNWYVDFEMTFYKAGTNSKQKMDTIAVSYTHLTLPTNREV